MLTRVKNEYALFVDETIRWGRIFAICCMTQHSIKFILSTKYDEEVGPVKVKEY